VNVTAVQKELALIGPEDRPLERVFDLLGGPTGVTRALAREGITITAWAVNKWLRAGRLPRTEYTGETQYAKALERSVNGQVTAEVLLEAGRLRARAEGM
jgi:hypothetical protein